ncbi:MAG: type VI secretion system tip protein TssI/VgrG, partial [Thermodesulfobacteriota bacterium]
MDYLTARKFEFVSTALAPDAFGVVNFEGTEGISACYRFEVNLVTTAPDLDLNRVLQRPAVFTLLRPEGNIPFHGILAEFEQRQAFDEYVFYRAVLVPKFWWLQLTFHNQVFLDRNVPEILEMVLRDGGLTTRDFELRLQKEYPTWEYVCQYQESHFHFASRWMEREGLYYFFEQTDQGEKLILTDTGLAHTPMPEGRTMYYSPPSGLDEPHREEVLHSLVCRQRMLPRKVILKDYNYRTPSLELSAEAEVLSDGRGEVFLYGEHFRTPEEGQALAGIRAEELLCRRRLFQGESTIPYLRPGYVFDLEDHYREDYNQKYLTTHLDHRGSQTAYLVSGIQKALSEVEKRPYYQNSFTVIPKNAQYRPERRTPPAKFYGTMNARIDGAGSGQYAELDDQGRYKVVLPFDLSGRKDGKASAWLRMAQPYAGADHGMHFPLHKGTEVLLTFIDGNPDRPIVAAAVPNPLTPSPLNSALQTMAHITTSGQNKFHFQDLLGSQRILMYSPTVNSWMRMGAHNDPPPPSYVEDSDSSSDGVRIHADGNMWLEAKKRYAEYTTGVPVSPDQGPADAQYLIDKMYNYTDFA